MKILIQFSILFTGKLVYYPKMFYPKYLYISKLIKKIKIIFFLNYNNELLDLNFFLLFNSLYS